MSEFFFLKVEKLGAKDVFLNNFAHILSETFLLSHARNGLPDEDLCVLLGFHMIFVTSMYIYIYIYIYRLRVQDISSLDRKIT